MSFCIGLHTKEKKIIFEIRNVPIFTMLTDDGYRILPAFHSEGAPIASPTEQLYTFNRLRNRREM